VHFHQGQLLQYLSGYDCERESFRRSGRSISCSGCFCIATVESDLLFSLDGRAIFNTIGHLVRRHTTPAHASAGGPR